MYEQSAMCDTTQPSHLPWPDLLQPTHGYSQSHARGYSHNSTTQWSAENAQNGDNDDHFQVLQEILGDSLFSADMATAGHAAAGQRLQAQQDTRLPNTPVPIQQLINTHRITAVTPPFNIEVNRENNKLCTSQTKLPSHCVTCALLINSPCHHLMHSHTASPSHRGTV